METDAAPTRLLNTLLFNDRGLRAGWRLLIYIGILLVFRLVAVTLLAHFFGKSGPLAITEMTPGFTIFGDGAVFLLLLLAAFIMSRVERRSMAEYGLPLKGQPVLGRFVAGYIVWGFLPLTIVLLIMRIFHGFSFGQLTLHGGQIAIFGLEWAVAFVLVGLAEDYMLRGYSLYTLADGIGFWPAAIFMAALFGLGHAGNPGESRIGLIGTVVFALFASLTLRLTGNLWLAIGAHAGWDWGQSFFYGVSDSGLTARGHLFQPSFHGPSWLTGGSVGPEGSVVTLILWAAMIVLFALVYRRRGPALVLIAETKH